MLSPLLVTLVLSQHVRSQVDRSDPRSQCLWWPDATVISVEQNANGNPETPGETEFVAITSAFTTWGTALDACTNLRFDELTRTTSRTAARTAGTWCSSARPTATTSCPPALAPAGISATAGSTPTAPSRSPAAGDGEDAVALLASSFGGSAASG